MSLDSPQCNSHVVTGDQRPVTLNNVRLEIETLSNTTVRRNTRAWVRKNEQTWVKTLFVGNMQTTSQCNRPSRENDTAWNPSVNTVDGQTGSTNGKHVEEIGGEGGASVVGLLHLAVLEQLEID